MRGLIALLLLLIPGVATAAGNVRLTSSVFVEETVTGEDGKARTILQQPNMVTPGDQLVFVLNYRNEGNDIATNVVVTNPLPNAVVFSDALGPPAEFSVDGGRNWGTLGTLRVRMANGRLRSARPDDVTHVRWTIRQPIAVGAGGKLTFRGTVR